MIDKLPKTKYGKVTAIISYKKDCCHKGLGIANLIKTFFGKGQVFNGVLNLEEFNELFRACGMKIEHITDTTIRKIRTKKGQTLFGQVIAEIVYRLDHEEKGEKLAYILKEIFTNQELFKKVVRIKGLKHIGSLLDLIDPHFSIKTFVEELVVQKMTPICNICYKKIDWGEKYRLTMERIKAFTGSEIVPGSSASVHSKCLERLTEVSFKKRLPEIPGLKGGEKER